MYRPVVVDKADSTVMGLWEPEHRRILIRRSLKGQVAWQTFLHELLHAAHFDTGTSTYDTREERACDSGASGMMHVVIHLLTLPLSEVAPLEAQDSD